MYPEYRACLSLYLDIGLREVLRGVPIMLVGTKKLSERIVNASWTKVSVTREGATQHRQLGFQPSIIMSSQTFYRVVIIALSYRVSCIPGRFLCSLTDKDTRTCMCFRQRRVWGWGSLGKLLALDCHPLM